MARYIWISSDLQLACPTTAREVLANAIDDVLQLELPVEEAWCLGDALVGADLRGLESVADACIELYERLGVPVTYVMGNHETDLLRHGGVNRFPLYERVKNRDGWYTMPSIADFYFTRNVLGHRVVFLGDHAAEDGRWVTSGGTVRGMADRYPHGQTEWAGLRDAIASSPQPVIIASHYAFRGGQRPSELQDSLLPLPSSVRAHFHGHAHIGDLVWNGDDPWERVHLVEKSKQRQFNVSALETERSPGSHSAMLVFEDNGSLHIRFRCHLSREWIGEHVLFAASAANDD